VAHPLLVATSAASSRPPRCLPAYARASSGARNARRRRTVCRGVRFSSKVRLEAKPMRSLRQFLLAITALLLCACGTGYDYKPSLVDCNDPANYFTCHFSPNP